MSTERDRALMVERQLAARGIRDPRVLTAFGRIPREAFIPPALHAQAYADHPLPIGSGQTISQPLMVANMLEALELAGSERVLEIGVGSGYSTALLSLLARWVYGMERHANLLAGARAALEGLGIENVVLRAGDGTLGWREFAPFDAIVVAAGAPEIPQPLVDQLAPGGRLVIPVGDAAAQELVRVRKDPQGNPVVEKLGGCRFVPLIGRFGWDKSAAQDGGQGSGRSG